MRWGEVGTCTAISLLWVHAGGVQRYHYREYNMQTQSISMRKWIGMATGAVRECMTADGWVGTDTLITELSSVRGH